MESQSDWRERLKPTNALTEQSMFPKPYPDKLTIAAPLLGSRTASDAFQDNAKLELDRSNDLSRVTETTAADAVL